MAHCLAVSQGLGLAGSALTAVGVALTLVGIGRVRKALRSFAERTLPQFFRRDGQIYAEALAISIEITATARGRVRPGLEGWGEERWREEYDKEFDELWNAIDSHEHKRTKKALDRLHEEDQVIRADIQRRVEHLTDQAKASERWTGWGLALALAGACIQVIALSIPG